MFSLRKAYNFVHRIKLAVNVQFMQHLQFLRTASDGDVSQMHCVFTALLCL